MLVVCAYEKLKMVAACILWFRNGSGGHPSGVKQPHSRSELVGRPHEGMVRSSKLRPSSAGNQGGSSLTHERTKWARE